MGSNPIKGNTDLREEIKLKIQSFESSPKEYNKYILNLYNSSKNYDLTKYKKNLSKLIKKINSLNEKTETYKTLSCIFGAFMGDSIGAYLEFHKPSKDNHLKIYKEKTIFGLEAGSITDDSSMAISLAYAIMDTKKRKELDQNLIYFYYGAWALTNPPDMGNATNNALIFFDYDNCVYGDNFFNEDIKNNIYINNYCSKANGFLMRISTFVVFFYYRFKNECEVIKSEEKKDLLNLYNKIKNIVFLDNEIIHPNKENNIACSIFVFMAICALFNFKGKEIIKKVELLLQNDVFSKNEEEINVKNIILEDLETYKQEKINYKNFNVYNKMGYYAHAFKLTLYYLCIIDDIKHNKYEYIMNQICDYGGDTDTNCAIVGTVIGPLIGYKNFSKDKWKTFINYLNDNNFQFCSALMFIYVKFLEKSNSLSDSEKFEFNFYKMIFYMLNADDINIDKIFDIN